MTNNHIIPFSYNVYVNNDLFRCNETVTLSLSEKEIRQVAAIMDGNGGPPVEMAALESLTEKIEENIYVNKLPELLPEDADLDYVFVKLQEKMPDELVEAADRYVRMKNVSIAYYLQNDGEEIKKEAGFGISPAEFNAMRKAILSGETRETDFALMKDLFPEEYRKVADLVEEWAYKECITQYGKPLPTTLKEFPYQVFTNL